MTSLTTEHVHTKPNIKELYVEYQHQLYTELMPLLIFPCHPACAWFLVGVDELTNLKHIG